MNQAEQKLRAKEFVEEWKGKGYEKGETQRFWIDLLQTVYGVKNATRLIHFEDNVSLDNESKFVDGRILNTKVLIEQKSLKVDLKKAYKQSDGEYLTPFDQALRYANLLNNDERPRWIIVSNFKSFLIYDMNNRGADPEEVLLENLEKEYYRLEFVVDKKNHHIKKEEEVSFKAGEIVGKLYDAFSKEYEDISDVQSQKDLNELCVRLVFCLYAEDAGLFGKKSVFHDYLAKFDDLTLMRTRLIELFKILDTPYDKRDKYIEEELNQFPYVNGGLFSNENIEIPKFTKEIQKTLLENASDDFDWSEISPTIFGAVFESTLNPETRRSGGMHYTSTENIHKVIDPLFLNNLKEELEKIVKIKNLKERIRKLEEFQVKLSTLKFFDPACGSGNFLTETYIALRRLENEVLSILANGAMMLEMTDTIKVSIQQFYGIEINDFAVKVAKTALWIAEAKMFTETEELLFNTAKLSDFFPLQTYENIIEGNSLRIDWNEVLPSTECNYIIGNPPFVGAYHLNDKQKEERLELFGKGSGVLDYVACWYKKAAEYIEKTKIKVAYVSTSSITQGQQVEPLWNVLKNYDIEIDFAYEPFKWESEASKKAGVFCVIIGFSIKNKEKKMLFDKKGNEQIVDFINGYLKIDTSILVRKSSKPISNVPQMAKGFQPTDNGFLILSKDEYEEVKDDEKIVKWIRKYSMGEEFINGKDRYCLWLVNITPSELKSIPFIKNRVSECKKWRENQTITGDAYKLRNTPHLFRPCKKFDNKTYIGVPKVSSSNRKYIPMGFVDNGMIPGDKLYFINTDSLYILGVMESYVHMSWVRTITGRLGDGFSYSNTIVYNNFPWPEVTEVQKEKIEKTAQAILDARDLYLESSLADLYDETLMPIELRKAHEANDKAVMEAYGFKNMTEQEMVAELMKKYKEIIDKK